MNSSQDRILTLRPDIRTLGHLCPRADLLSVAVGKSAMNAFVSARFVVVERSPSTQSRTLLIAVHEDPASQSGRPHEVRVASARADFEAIAGPALRATASSRPGPLRVLDLLVTGPEILQREARDTLAMVAMPERQGASQRAPTAQGGGMDAPPAPTREHQRIARLATNEQTTEFLLARPRHETHDAVAQIADAESVHNRPLQDQASGRRDVSAPSKVDSAAVEGPAADVEALAARVMGVIERRMWSERERRGGKRT
jgi:hypothetical protein